MTELYIFSLLLLIFLNFILCFVEKKERYDSFLCFIDILSIIVMVVIMTHANFSDLLVYERHYSFSKDAMLNSRFEGGFNWYMVFCKYFLGLTYTQFKLMTFTLCIILFYFAYRKITYNFSYFAMLFMMYEMFFDGIQIRNFMAISIITLGIPYLFRGGVKGVTIYFITVLLAFSIHHSSLALLIFILIGLPLRKILELKSVRYLLLIIASVSLYLFIDLTKKGTLKKLLIRFSYMYVSEDVGNRMVSHSAGRWGGSQIYLFILIVLYCCFVFVLSKDNIVSRIDNYKYSFLPDKLMIKKRFYEVDIAIKKYFMYLNFLSLFFIILCIFSSTFYRLLRDICLIDVIYFSTIINNAPKKGVRIIVWSVSIILIGCWIYYDLIVPQRFFSHIQGFLN